VAFSLRAVLVLSGCACLLIATCWGAPSANFERNYTPQGTAHLKLSNINGDVYVRTWNKKTLNVRASAASWVTIEDEVTGDEISVSVKRSLRLGRADFEVFVPAETSVSLKNMMGKIEVQGVSGHLSVDSFDSDVRLTAISSPSVDVRVTTGDVSFDGQLQADGSYTFQSVKGDIDVTVPGASSFTLNARALSENINLGDFLSNLSGLNRAAKGISGTYLRGGPRLNLTTYAGRILLHKK
jgi:DUF4097 and DUF4098 domain-containing protein YvlB